MKVQKLQESDAFIVFDLDPETPHAGIARVAPKILVDGATTLARSLTYLYATFEQQVGGASVGINARPDDRAATLERFLAEVGPLVQRGSLLVRPGKGLTDDDLAPLQALVPDARLAATSVADLLGAGAVHGAIRARGDLAGARVAIDGLDRATASVLGELGPTGASVVAVAGPSGTVVAADGIDADRLAAAIDEHGPAAVEHLDLEVLAPGAVFGADCDVLFTGSKVGVVDHAVAATVTAGFVVPIGPVPVTAKALAVLRRADVVVLPDFVTAAGPWFATFPDAPESADELRAAVIDQVPAALDSVLGHEDGPLLGGCYRAEAFLRSWQDDLPFGRPLA